MEKPADPFKWMREQLEGYLEQTQLVAARAGSGLLILCPQQFHWVFFIAIGTATWYNRPNSIDFLHPSAASSMSNLHPDLRQTILSLKAIFPSFPHLNLLFPVSLIQTSSSRVSLHSKLHRCNSHLTKVEGDEVGGRMKSDVVRLFFSP